MSAIGRNPFSHKVIRRFTPAEDEKLTKLVKLYGAGNWLFIASCMKTRNSRQCKDRWLQYLSPDSNQSAWTEEEEERLRTLYHQYNGHWLEIGKYFEGRALAQIRNKWKTLERRRIVGRQRRSKYSVKKTYTSTPTAKNQYVQEEHYMKVIMKSPKRNMPLIHFLIM